MTRSLAIFIGGLGLAGVAFSWWRLHRDGVLASGAGLDDAARQFFAVLLMEVTPPAMVAVYAGWVGIVLLVIALFGLYANPYDRIEY